MNPAKTSLHQTLKKQRTRGAIPLVVIWALAIISVLIVGRETLPEIGDVTVRIVITIVLALLASLFIYELIKSAVLKRFRNKP